MYIFQTSIVYELIGLSNAPDYFEVHQTTGEVRVKADIKDDPVKQDVYHVSLWSQVYSSHLALLS